MCVGLISHNNNNNSLQVEVDFYVDFYVENGHSKFISLMFSSGDSFSLIFLNLFSTISFQVRAQLETVFIPLVLI